MSQCPSKVRVRSFKEKLLVLDTAIIKLLGMLLEVITKRISLLLILIILYQLMEKIFN